MNKIFSRLNQDISRTLTNMPGFRTNRKIVVFESDDWGSVRLPDIKYIKKFKWSFPDYYKSPYFKYDSLASVDDLNSLFSVLRNFKDFNGNHPIFTFNTVMSNPDFDKIRESGFSEYFYELFTVTLQRYSNHSRSFDLWRNAMDEKLLYPQFHGREHVNVPLWLGELKRKNVALLTAFELGSCSIPNNIINGINLQASLDWKEVQPIYYQENFIKEGLSSFKNVFGFCSETMIPNNFILDPNLHPLLKENGINTLQGMKYQKLPIGYSPSNRKMIRRHLGELNESGIRYLVRNCSFEPSQTKEHFDDVDYCLRSISNAFFWNKPAIIDTHRLNYIGVYEKRNTDMNLKKLDLLVKRILSKWNEVEFMTSKELSEVINSERKDFNISN